MKKLLMKLFAISFPKIVIAFRSSGGQAEIDKFRFIGYVIKEWESNNVDYYILKIIKKGTWSIDIRDQDLGTEKVWQIQHLIFNIYLSTD